MRKMSSSATPVNLRRYRLKTTIQVLITTIAIGSSLIPVKDAFASITLNGTIPPGQNPVVVIPPNNQPAATGTLKFKFSVPQAGPYAMNFCIGATDNPCGTSDSYVVVVPAGEERLAIVDASFFTNKVLVVSQGTATALPYVVTVE